jgi:hypothetical protein
MKPGATVRLVADPARVCVVTSQIRSRGGITYWQIRVPDRTDYCRGIHLEIVSEEDDDPIALLHQGKLSPTKDLRGSLTHLRLSGRLVYLIHSMGATNTNFIPISLIRSSIFWTLPAMLFSSPMKSV